MTPDSDLPSVSDHLAERLQSGAGLNLEGIASLAIALPGGAELSWRVDFSTSRLYLAPPAGSERCCMRVSLDVFRSILRGEINAAEAFCRGQLRVEGDFEFARSASLALLG
jgi:hypothetical protein